MRLHHVSELCRHEALLLDLFYVFQVILDLYLLHFHVPCKYQIKQQILLVPSRRETTKSSLDYKLAELLLHLKTAIRINNTFNIYCEDIYIS